jgi:hypothetical protein
LPDLVVNGLRRTDALVLGALVVAGLAVHAHAMFTFLYVFDEVGVIRRQVSMLQAAVADRSLWGFLVDAPLASSNALTPLWAWQQYLFVSLLGAAPNVTRLLPILWSLGPIALSYLLVLPRLGTLTAACTSATFVLLDTVLWTGTKSEFAECMLITCVIGAVILTLRGTLRDFAAAACFLGLTPLTYFGKGLFLYVAFAIWLFEAGAALSWKGMWKRYALLALSLVPTLLWLLLADVRVKALAAAGTPLMGDLGRIESILQQARRVSVDYFKYRENLKGPPTSVLIVYADFKAWPTGTLLAPWAILGVIAGLRRMAAAIGEERALLKVLVGLGLVPFAFLVLNGYSGERFTLTWGLAFALSVGIGVSSTVSGLLSPDPRIHRRAATAAGAVWLYTAAALSMTSWVTWTFDAATFAEIAAAGFALTVPATLLAERLSRSAAPSSPGGVLARLRPSIALTTLLPLACLVPWSLLRYGPLMWGRKQGWGVEATNAPDFEARLRRHGRPRSAEVPPP